jgi:hypothetical protein
MAGHSELVSLDVCHATSSGNARASDKRTIDVSAETSQGALPRFVPIFQSFPKWN